MTVDIIGPPLSPLACSWKDKQMKTPLTIDEIMHPFPHTVGSNQTLAVVKEMFRQHGIRHLPVCDRGKLCGILSERDVDFALRVDKESAENLLVKDCCTPEPYAVSASTPTDVVVRKMAQEKIGCAVITEKDRVVGIFTTVDACRALAELLSTAKEQ